MKRKMLEIPAASEQLAGWYCSGCAWEYRLVTPLHRDKLGFYVQAAAETLHFKHRCHDYCRAH